ncbi:MAG TPA: zf-HC2 domain-containing protein [Burkholderiales bacterium]|jgi:hypothetical protein|nr:zf-HC2 domain-containing protein [Burkholderiales bacterium]
MNCDAVTERLEDFVDRLLPLPEADAVERHVALCRSCRRALEAERGFRALLRAHPVQGPSRGFARRALAEADHTDRKLHRRGFVAGFASAAALALATWFVLMPAQRTAEPDADLHEVRMALKQVKSVHLVFHVPRDIPDGTMSLELPEHVELSGHPGRRSLTWHTALASGTNNLTLPIVARKVASADLRVRISYGEKQQIFKVRLSVYPGDAAGGRTLDSKNRAAEA